MMSERVEPRSVLVVGAGPSGLVCAKTILEQGYHVTIIEQSPYIGGAFKHKAYDEGSLVSSKYLTAFSDYPMPTAYNVHPSMGEYVQYLENYSQHYGVTQHIRFNTTLVKLVKQKNGAHLAYFTVNTVSSSADNNTSREYQDTFDYICVCSGLHNVPFVPSTSTDRLFKGRVMHSSAYKKKDVFQNKRVVIVGAGETGLDIAYRAIQATDQSVTLVARSGFLSVPKELRSGLALDTFI